MTKKFAKIVDPERGICDVGLGDPEAVYQTVIEETGKEKTLYVSDFYKSLGMEEMEVEQGTDGNWYLSGFVPPPEITPADYDRAMEAHIKEARVARGYTTREPTEYLGSAVPRWAQDAADYVAFRDSCMLYGLDVQNKYAAGEPVPSLEEFKASLPECVWTYTETEA